MSVIMIYQNIKPTRKNNKILYYQVMDHQIQFMKNILIILSNPLLNQNSVHPVLLINQGYKKKVNQVLVQRVYPQDVHLQDGHLVHHHHHATYLIEAHLVEVHQVEVHLHEVHQVEVHQVEVNHRYTHDMILIICLQVIIQHYQIQKFTLIQNQILIKIQIISIFTFKVNFY